MFSNRLKLVLKYVLFLEKKNKMYYLHNAHFNVRIKYGVSI